MGRRGRTTKDEERALAERMRSGDRTALDELVSRNGRLATWLAGKYARGMVTCSDLQTVAILAMIEAAPKFDPERGRFGTYVMPWVLRDVRNALAAGAGPVAVPRRRPHALRDTVAVPYFRSAEDGPGLFPEDVTASLEDAERVLFVREIRALVEAHLSPKEAEIVRLRFGFGGGDPATFAEIGHVLGISRERVRQIEAGALARLRTVFARRGHPIREELRAIRGPVLVPALPPSDRRPDRPSGPPLRTAFPKPA